MANIFKPIATPDSFWLTTQFYNLFERATAGSDNSAAIVSPWRLKLSITLNKRPPLPDGQPSCIKSIDQHFKAVAQMS
mgnify:CR=1 FL=1